MAALFTPDEFAKVKDLLIIYGCGLKTVTNKLDILNEDFRSFHKTNPIEHIKSRLKTPESIAAKLFKKGVDVTVESARNCLYDIAGVRIICSFTKDIPSLVQVIKNQSDIAVIDEKDYVSVPKPSGYRSYHIITEVPVYLTESLIKVPVEVQIRTAAMDFWASLEHKVRYKFNEEIPKHLSDELVLCADKIAELDERMFLIHDILNLINPTSNK
jgi:putative GTP pyrophosphokinase